MAKTKGDGGSFILPPPIAGNWLTLPQEEADLLCTRLGESRVPGLDLHGGALVRVLPLSFWKGWILCDVQPGPEPLSGPAALLRARKREDSNEQPAIHSLVYGPDGFMILDGQSAPIHGHNARHGIELPSAEAERDYLRFFCFFVRGEEGPFEVVEEAGRLDLTGDRKTRAKVKPLSPIPGKAGADDDGRKVYAASIHYGNALFNAQLALHPTGMVEMLDDEPLSQNVGISPSLQFRGTARWEMPPQEIQ